METENTLRLNTAPFHAIEVYPLNGLLWWRQARIRAANRRMSEMLSAGWTVSGAISIGSCLVVHYLNREAATNELLRAAALAAHQTREQDDTTDPGGGWGAS